MFVYFSDLVEDTLTVNGSKLAQFCPCFEAVLNDSLYQLNDFCVLKNKYRGNNM